MKNKNPNSTAAPPEIDRLSALPDVILEEILSLLPTSAAATAVLSRRWHHLWTRVTRIHFDADDFSPSISVRKFLTSVESALRRLDSFSNIKYFYVRFHFCTDEFGAEDYEFDEPEDNFDFWYSFINRWFGRICGLHTLRIIIDRERSYHTPDAPDNSEYRDFVRICVQNSLVLKAVNSTSDDAGLELPDCPICLPPFLFQSETLIELSLTNMFLHHLPENFNLPNLKIFALDVLVLSETLISIDVPKLEQFSVEISYSLLFPSLFIRFVSIPSALSSAQLMLGDGYPAMEILKGIFCTTSLVLTFGMASIFNPVNVNALPSFQNLTHLSLLLSSNEDRSLDIPVWLFGKVKSIEGKVSGNLVRLSLLKDLLSKATVLERFCVSFSRVTYGKIDLLQQENDFVKDLFMLPRVSSHCEIEFKGIVVSASTNDP